MFGPRTKGEEGETQETATISTGVGNTPAQAQPRVAAPAPRRIVDMPGTSRRASSASDAEKKLIVGKGLSLAGEITSCDILVVEGKVEAKLTDGKLLEITESGQFRGSVEIENADIAGRYDGQLVVHGRLTVRSTGRISGMVKYGELEVNAGGQIIGEVQVANGGVQAQQGNGFKNAAKFAALSGDEEQDEQRKSA
jgi:cytoskeletal protein CcmA (bactofilin family)